MDRRTLLSADRGIQALHSLKHNSMDGLNNDMEGLVTSIRHVQFFAEALLLNQSARPLGRDHAKGILELPAYWSYPHTNRQ